MDFDFNPNVSDALESQAAIDRFTGVREMIETAAHAFEFSEMSGGEDDGEMKKFGSDLLGLARLTVGFPSVIGGSAEMPDCADQSAEIAYLQQVSQIYTSHIMVLERIMKQAGIEVPALDVRNTPSNGPSRKTA